MFLTRVWDIDLNFDMGTALLYTDDQNFGSDLIL